MSGGGGIARYAQCGQIHADCGGVQCPAKNCGLSLYNTDAESGVVRVGAGQSFVMADIPGIIGGAAEGAGLGHRFLKHLQRTRLLLHLVDITPDQAIDPAMGVRAIMDELRRYDVALYEKPRWLVFNKTDQIPDELQKTCIENFIQRLDWKGPIFALSALTRQGCAELIQAIYQYLACKTPVPVQ